MDLARFPLAATSLILAQSPLCQQPLPVLERSEWRQAPGILSSRVQGGMTFDWNRGRLVVFGGHADSEFYADMWEHDGNRWIEREPAGTWPPGYPQVSLAFDRARAEVLMVGGESVLGSQVRTWTWRDRWTYRATAGPPARVDYALGYDELRQVAVLFGGADRSGQLFNDTWEWNGTSWRQIHTTTSPPARQQGAMALDPVTRRMLLVGGHRALSDTWTFDGSNWTYAAQLPGGRWGVGLAADSAVGRLVLFGGFLASGNATAETFEWDGSRWMAIQTSGSPPPAGLMLMASDPTRGIVAFGGRAAWSGAGTSAMAGELWTYYASQQTWIRSPETVAPPSINYFYQAAADTARRRIVCYQPDPGRGTWEWDGRRWHVVQSAIGPTVRLPKFAYHTPSASCVLFGGNDAMAQPTNETWMWDGSSWSRPTGPAPGPAGNHVLVEDRRRGVLVLFDAYHSGLLWEWDGSRWTSRQSGGGPLRRARPLGAFDQARGVLVVFGGDRGARTDTWEWDGSRWAQVSTVGPHLDIGSAMTFDERRGVCVLVGAPAFDRQGQVWEYDPRRRQWDMTSDGVMQAAWWPALCYDPMRGQVFCHGGSAFASFASTRTWLYTPMDLVPARQETDPGGRLSFGLIRPNDAGSLFLTGLALGGDGIPIMTSAHGQILWPLANDLLLRVSLQIPTLRGTLDAQGRGRAYLDLPSDSALSGLYIAASALLLDAQGIRSVTRDTRALVR